MPHLNKKSVEEIDVAQLREPQLSEDDRRDFKEGWQLFNQRHFWHAHEAWENVWKRCPDESRIFFQGIIQLAAAYHLLVVKKRYGGMMRNFEKAEAKLKLFPATFLGVDVIKLLAAIEAARANVQQIGPERLASFDTSLLPFVVLES